MNANSIQKSRVFTTYNCNGYFSVSSKIISLAIASNKLDLLGFVVPVVLECCPNPKFWHCLVSTTNKDLSRGSGSTVPCHLFNSTCSIGIYYYAPSNWQELIIWHTCLNRCLTELSSCA